MKGDRGERRDVRVPRGVCEVRCRFAIQPADGRIYVGIYGTNERREEPGRAYVSRRGNYETDRGSAPSTNPRPRCLYIVTEENLLFLRGRYAGNAYRLF